MGYQIGGAFRINAGVGVSSIAFGKLDVQGDLREDLNSDPIILADVVSSFGLFEEKETPELFKQPIDPVTGVGFVSSLGIEFGLLNDFAIGLSNQFRYYPKFYDGQSCAHVFNLNAYVRLRFSTLGSKR